MATAAEAAATRRAVDPAARAPAATAPAPVADRELPDTGGNTAADGHRRADAPHAEAHALRAARPRARGLTAVAPEPCHHTGRTGPGTRFLDEAAPTAVAVPTDTDADTAAARPDGPADPHRPPTGPHAGTHTRHPAPLAALHTRGVRSVRVGGGARPAGPSVGEGLAGPVAGHTDPVLPGAGQDAPGGAGISTRAATLSDLADAVRLGPDPRTTAVPQPKES